MTRHVALLRAVNVTGVNKVGMKELTAVFESLGHRDVVAYIQSGNVVFSPDPTARVTDQPAQTQLLRVALREAINARFALSIDLVLFDAHELSMIVDRTPFVSDGRPFEGTHIGFLAETASEEGIARLDPHRSPPDQFVVDGRAVHFWYPAGIGRTKLTTTYLERALGNIMTVRNRNTVERLVQLATS